MIRYHPLFDCDIREAAAWYDQHSEGLGDRFVESVRESVNKVIENPERFSVSPAGLRYVQTRHFPYVILFDVIDDDLVLLTVIHTARSPEKWRERSTDF